MSADTARKLGLVVLALLIGLLLWSDPRAWLPGVAVALQEAGPGGRALFGLGYVLATVLFLPASVITLVSGFAWGPVGGTLVVWPAATLGAIGAFYLGRGLMRAPLERRFAADERFAAIDRAVADDGLRLVLLLRLSPLFPFNALNYALGLTSVSARDYIVGTAVGILPGTALYVWIGSTVADLASLTQGTSETGLAGKAMGVVGLLATLGAVVLTGRAARAALDGRLRPPET